MVESLILIEGKEVREESLAISLANAKQVVVGSVNGFGVILHVAATTSDDLRNALTDFAKVRHVTGIITLMIRSRQ